MHSNWKIFWHSDHLLELGDKWIKSCLLNNSNKSCPKSVHTSHIFYYIFKYLHNSQWYCLLCCRNTPDAALLVTHLKSLQWDRNSQKPPSQQIRTSNCPLQLQRHGPWYIVRLKRVIVRNIKKDSLQSVRSVNVQNACATN